MAAHGARVVAAAVACALVGRGWKVEALPGEPVVLRRDGRALRPFAVMAKLSAGEADPAEWAELHTSAGISDAPLAPPAST
jgi:hypothetical protein